MGSAKKAGEHPSMKDGMGTLTSEEAEFLKVYLDGKIKEAAGGASVNDVAEKASTQKKSPALKKKPSPKPEPKK
jgi:hypothetical protein